MVVSSGDGYELRRCSDRLTMMHTMMHGGARGGASKNNNDREKRENSKESGDVVSCQNVLETVYYL
ncbi:hypothetical protein M6B38_139785 [Iris pallida]|uniref:Uncharacterized protein n=1 Tax=Iris pallida TaxID=29817 RepID=A0AAX6FD88_IRIPA|nr:hypothetical protein M6B38_139785 [Iris pallida]